MNRILLFSILLTLCSISRAEDVTIRFDGTSAHVVQSRKDSVNISVEGASVNVESQFKAHKLTLRLSGKSDNGQLTLKTAGKALITLDGLTLTSQEGAPLCLKNKKKVEIKSAKGTENTLTITACQDTAAHKGAVIWAKDKLLLSGKGVLNVVATGDGCRGIKTKKDITVEDVTLNITTSGNNLGEKPFSFGNFPMPDFASDSTMRGHFSPFDRDSIQPGNFPGPDFGGSDMPPGLSKSDSTMRDHFPPFDRDSIQPVNFPGPDFGGNPPFGSFGMSENDSIMPGGFGGKRKYVASTKGIASKGKITINSGNITVRTSTPGAEGIEGKQGIVFNGGTVDVLSLDDAINANAAIEFNGAEVTARSTGNDAIDANPEGGFFPPFGSDGEHKIDPAIIIRGGTVLAWSQTGPPEEGLDSDMAPLAIEGGTVFTVGGFIGEMPSVPTNETAKQPTALLTGLDIANNEPIRLFDAKGKLLATFSVPFSLRHSASILSSPAFQLGATYTISTKSLDTTFTLTEPFTTIKLSNSPVGGFNAPPSLQMP